MLTVKHCVGGTERLYEAPFGVEYVGPHAQWGIGGPHISIPLADDAPGLGVNCKALHGGHAYVMNGEGATVGTYRLGDAPTQAGEMQQAMAFSSIRT